MDAFRYRLTVRVDNVSVPEQENVPEHAQVEFETHPDNKIAGIQEILSAISKAWPEIRELYNHRGDNGREM